MWGHNRGRAVWGLRAVPADGVSCATAHADGPARVTEGPEDAGVGGEVSALVSCSRGAARAARPARASALLVCPPALKAALCCEHMVVCVCGSV